MRAYQNSKHVTGRSSTSCGYCRIQGHSIKECPYIEYDHTEWRAHRVPVKSKTVTDSPHGRYMMTDYSYWVKQVDKYYPKWKKWQAPQQGTTRVVSPRKCGFCRGTDHTRKDCTEMQSIYKDLLQANRNYRQSLYDTLVAKLGLGVGAVVKVQRNRGNYSSSQTEEVLATIDEINMDTANLFLAERNYHLDGDYKGTVQVTLIGDNGGYYGKPALQVSGLIDHKGRKLCEGVNGYYYQNIYLETVCPSKTPLPPDWVDRDADAFEWLLKKRSKQWLEDRRLLSVINRWK